MAVDLIERKIERADKHIHDLEAALLAFKKTDPYKVGSKVEAETGMLAYYITKADDVPNPIPLIAGDALQNLRTALDHLAWQLTPASDRNSSVAFPVSDDATKYEAEKVRKIKGMAKAAIDAIDATKPYKGGNDVLWRLHKLNNIDKHRLLLTVGSAYSAVNVAPHIVGRMIEAGIATHLKLPTGTRLPFPAIYLKPSDRQFPLKVGSILFRDAPGAQVNDKMNFLIDIAFGEPGICEGDPMIETLKGMLDLIRNIVSDFAPLLP
jgi:hypothetical protein